jgi:DNA modification methylase
MAVRIINADVMDGLAQLPDASVNCCVTSPPYFGLRDYGVTGQIGLERTPDEFIAKLVAVFREVRRVLTDDGTCWVNIGDSYSTHAAGKIADPMAKSTLAGVKTQRVANKTSREKTAYRNHTLPEKNLLGIPWHLAFGLQADGWYLRQDIIWHKPNPMPESVTDRCTKSHEYIFLLTKSARYWYDAEGISEPVAPSTVERLSQPTIDQQNGSGRVPGKTNGNMKAKPPRFGGSKYGDNDDPKHQTKSGKEYELGSGRRNRRSVWQITTQPFSEAHFATFPPELPELCIKAGCPKGGTVLDPFFGAGTTGLVADRLGRNAIGIELNPEYAAMARKRIMGDAPLLTEVA